MSEVPDIIGWEELPKRAQLEVRRRLADGKKIRCNPQAPYAGRCGAETANGSPFCGRLAGYGTKRDKWGRCVDHEESEAGLAPWFGHIPDSVLQGIGANLVRREGDRTTHGASRLVEASLDDIFAKYLDEDEIQLMQLAISRPVDLLSVLMGVRSAGLLRIQKWIQTQRQLTGGIMTAELIGAEGMADRTATTIARLAESRKGYLELEESSATQGAFRDLLRRLSDEDLAAAKRDPRIIAQLARGAEGPDLMH